MKRIIVLMCICMSLVSCSSAPVIVDEGPDTYMAYKEAATGFTGTAPLKIEAMRAAAQYCESFGKKYVVVSTNEIPGGALGRYPGAEVHFRCLKEGDRDLNRPTLAPMPNAVIKVQH